MAKMAKLDRAAADVLRSGLLDWYELNRRDLPWRRNPDPYSIWVSEIMLQQTRVAVVVDHYRAFLQRFPTLASLALAREEDVLAEWSGLGYYRRARMLHKAAQFVVNQLNSNLPATAEELRALPGVGAYTAAAIASIAYGEPVAVVRRGAEEANRWAGRPARGSGAARRLQPGNYGAGGDGLPAAESGMPGVPLVRRVQDAGRAPHPAAAAHVEPRDWPRAFSAHRPAAGSAGA
jgi:A/G-specific adenine glycosylase